jgi:hypothetical protein
MVVGVYFSLQETKSNTNSSIIQITEIGITDPSSTAQNGGLQCITDRRSCCRTNQTGEWQFPNGTIIPRYGSNSFYRNRGYDDGTVNLNRVSTDVLQPTGLFCCTVPDTNNTNQTLCVNIGKNLLHVIIILSI